MWRFYKHCTLTLKIKSNCIEDSSLVIKFYRCLIENVTMQKDLCGGRVCRVMARGIQYIVCAILNSLRLCYQCVNYSYMFWG